VDISLEPAAGQKEAGIKPDNEFARPELARPNVGGDAVRSRIRDYLHAMPDFADPVVDLLPFVYETVQNRLSADARLDPMDVAIEESNRLLTQHWMRYLKQTSNQSNKKDPNHLLITLLCAHLAASVGENPTQQDRATAEFIDAELQQYHVPQRPMETFPKRMRSSLTRIPSFRLVGGWGVVILVLILTFLFTHRVP
jgi:hypothetical protein